jgi:ABC-type multidrug transport system ATPase subunit
LGDAQIDRHSISADSTTAKRAIAFMPDDPPLSEHLTVREHLQFTARFYRVFDFEDKANGRGAPRLHGHGGGCFPMVPFENQDAAF